MFSVFLYERETCSLPVRQEHMSSVLEKKVLRKVFGAKKRDGEQETGENFHYGGFFI